MSRQITLGRPSQSQDEARNPTIQKPSRPAGHPRLILAATLGITSLLFSLLELRSPYYFLQDDGLDYFLPTYFHNWESLLRGHLPLYDWHIFAGIPHVAMGQTAIFYLPQYLAMFLSETIWGQPFAAIGLMAFIHALIAVAGGYVLLRYLGATDLAAAFGGLTALSGFFLWAGRMWPIVLMLCAWFPWMVWASMRYLEKPTVGRAGWLMLFRLALLYGGYPQFFVLAMIFEHLFALCHSLVTRRDAWRARFAGYLALDLPTALLGMPFLLPVWAATERSLARSSPLSYGDFSGFNIPLVLWLFGQLLVFVQLRLPKGTIGASLPYLSYIGYIASLLSLGAAALWEKRRMSRPWIIACGVCFLVALLWCSNAIGPLLYHVPLLNRFRWPFKLIYFAGFFQCVVAALVLSLLSKRWQRIAIAGFIVNWIIVFCFLPSHAWRVRKYHVPLKSPWQQSLKNGRYFVISRGAMYHLSRQHVEFDFAELWGLDNLIGYEPLVSHRSARVSLGDFIPKADFWGSYIWPIHQSLLNHLKKWSVKYVLVGPYRDYVSAKLLRAGFRKVTVKQGWTLWEDPKAISRVHWGNVRGGPESDSGIRWSEHVNSIDVTLSQWPSRQLVFAFAANPGLETCTTGHCNPVMRSSDGLIRVDVPPGTRHVRLVYHNALLLPSALIALSTLVIYLLLLFRSRRMSSKHKLTVESVPMLSPPPKAN